MLARRVRLAGNLPQIARAVQLMVPSDFFSSLMMLCYCVLHVLRHFVLWNCCVQRMCSTVVCCHSIVFRNSVPAYRNGMALSRFLVAAATCVVLLRFAADSRRSHCNGSMRRVNGDLAAVMIFVFKISFQKCCKIVVLPLWRRDPVLELQIAAICEAVLPSSIVVCISVCRSHRNGCVKSSSLLQLHA